MDRLYGPPWHCIVGKGFGSAVTFNNKNMLFLYISNVAILLYRHWNSFQLIIWKTINLTHSNLTSPNFLPFMHISAIFQLNFSESPHFLLASSGASPSPDISSCVSDLFQLSEHFPVFHRNNCGCFCHQVSAYVSNYSLFRFWRYLSLFFHP